LEESMVPTLIYILETTKEGKASSQVLAQLLPNIFPSGDG